MSSFDTLVVEISKLSLGPKDILVVRSDGWFVQEIMDAINGLEADFKEVLFLPRDIELSVITKPEVDA